MVPDEVGACVCAIEREGEREGERARERGREGVRKGAEGLGLTLFAQATLSGNDLERNAAGGVQGLHQVAGHLP